MSKNKEVNETKISKEEENWRAEDDARTLMEYQKIISDEKRKERAIEKLKSKRKEVEASLKDLNSMIK